MNNVSLVQFLKVATIIVSNPGIQDDNRQRITKVASDSLAVFFFMFIQPEYVEVFDCQIYAVNTVEK